MQRSEECGHQMMDCVFSAIGVDAWTKLTSTSLF